MPERTAATVTVGSTPVEDDGAGPLTVAVLVGRPRTHVTASGRTVTTAFRKEPAEGPVAVGTTNLDGDEQADRRVHGGPDKAVLVCSADHAEGWRLVDRRLGAPGAFGENLHVRHLAEPDVCIGDRWRIGTVEVQVSQPRRPCWKVEDRWGVEGLVELMEETDRTGWYLRVIRTGRLRAGDRWHLLARPNADWSVAEANDVALRRRDDLDAAIALRALPELSSSWRRTLDTRIERLRVGGTEDAVAAEADRRRGPL